MTSSIKAALVLDTSANNSENDIQVIDIDSIQPIKNGLYIIKTKSFQNSSLCNGAGEILTDDELQIIKSFLH